MKFIGNKKIYIAIAILLLIYVMFILTTKGKPLIDTQEANKPKSFLAIHAPITSRPASLNLSGYIEAKNVAIISAQTDGIIKEILAKQGQRIKAGDTILLLDEKDKVTDFNRAKQALQQTANELKINQKLAKEGFIPPTKLEAVKTTYSEALNNMEKAKQNLEFTKIKAPIDGYVDKINFKKGDNLNNFTGKEITKIFNDNGFVVISAIPQNNIHKIKIGQKAIIKINEHQSINGTIDFISNLADQGTRTYHCEIDLENKMQDILLKMIGSPIDLKIIFDEVDTIYLPDSAVFLDDNGHLALKIINKNTVKLLPVEIIENENNGKSWFTSSDLKNYDHNIDVIIRGGGFLKEGDATNNIKFE